MAGIWNPDDPAALGLQWMASRGYTAFIRHGSSADILRMRSTVAETIRHLRAHMVATSPGTNLPLFTIFEVFQVGNEYPGAGSTKTVQLHPNADNLVGNWSTQSGATTNLWQSIDENVVYPPSPADFIQINGVPGISTYRAFVDDSPIPAGARILKLSILAVDAVEPSPNIGFRDFTYRLHYIPTGAGYTPPGASVDANIYGTLRRFDCGEINPQSNLPWTRADVAEFNAGDWALRVESVGDANINPALYSLALEVQYLDVENRVAAACWARPTSPATPAVITSNQVVSLPAGTSDWAKASGVDYSFLWRPAHAPILTGAGPFATDIRWSSTAAVLPGFEYEFPPAAQMAADSDVSLNGNGLPTGPVVFEHTNVPVLGLTRSDTALSVDGQPYVMDEIAFDSATPAMQRVRQTSGANQSYLGLRFLVAPPASGDSTLTVSIHRTSDGVQMGGSFQIDAATVRAMPYLDIPPAEGFQYRLIDGLLSTPAVLVSGVQYEVRFTPSAAALFWVASSPDGGALGAITYGGTTDYALRGAIPFSSRDLAAEVFIQPAALASVTAEVVSEALPADRCYCEVRRRDFAQVTWAQSTLGSSFAAYEVERQVDDVWSPIWRLTDIAVLQVADHEAPRNRPVKYRVRPVATTGATGNWVESDYVTCQTYGAELILTSNAEPQLTVVYDIEPRKTTTFVNHDGDEVVVPSGASGVLVFMDPHDRGRTREYTVIVNFGRLPTDGSGRVLGGDFMWEPLEAIVRAPANMVGGDPGPIPYVCVLDPYGRVTYGYVRMGRGTEDQPGHRYRLPIDVRPLVFEPTVLEA